MADFKRASGPETSSDLTRSRFGEVREHFCGRSAEFLHNVALDGAIPPDIFDRSTDNQQSVRPLQGVYLPVPHDRAAGLVGLVIADQMSFDWLGRRNGRDAHDFQQTAPGP